MLAAVTFFDSNTISPLFNVAQNILVVDLAQGRVHRVCEQQIGNLDLPRQLNLLTELGVEVVICGAISDFIHQALIVRGIRVYPWVSGHMEEVLTVLARCFETEGNARHAAGTKFMKIAVSAAGTSLKAAVDPCFRTCPYLLIIRMDDLGVVAHKSASGSSVERGTLHAARVIIDENARVLLTGRCGPNALGILSAAGIQVILGVEGSVREVVERFKRGELLPPARRLARRRS